MALVEIRSAAERTVYSYTGARKEYVNGHVVSRSSREFIMNLLSATAVRVLEKEDSSEDGSNSKAKRIIRSIMETTSLSIHLDENKKVSWRPNASAHSRQ